MKSLREVWAWDGIDYLIQIALICVFAYGALYASGANDTLTQQGCTAYWQEYNPSTNLSQKMFLNATEAENLKQNQPLDTSWEKNFTYSNSP